MVLRCTKIERQRQGGRLRSLWLGLTHACVLLNGNRDIVVALHSRHG